MAYCGLPCPACGAPVPLTPHALLTRQRCPSCGLLCLPTRVDGMVTLIPLAAPASRPASAPAPPKRDWSGFLPILVPAVSLAVVVSAICIREVNQALRRRQAVAGAVATPAKRPRRKPETPTVVLKTAPPAASEPNVPEPQLVEQVAQPDNFDVARQPLAEGEPLAQDAPQKEAIEKPQEQLDAPRRDFNRQNEQVPDTKDVLPIDAVSIPAAAPRPDAAVAREAPPFDEVGFFKSLREAKTRFRTTTAEGLTRFTTQCEDVVKREAKSTGDLELASHLLKEVDELKKSGRIPAGSQFEDARRALIDERKQADRDLYDIYKSTIDGLVRELQIERAINLKDEMEIFVRKEREFLGMTAAPPMLAGAGGGLAEKPLLIDLQTEKQIREYAAPDANSKIFLTIDELIYFPDGTKIRGEVETAPAGKPLVIDFAFISGPQLEVTCVHIPASKKLQLRVEPVFEEFGNREFDLTFPRLDKLESVTRSSIVRVENELQMLARAKYTRGLGDPGGELVVAQANLRSLQSSGPYSDFPREHARKASLTRAANLVGELSKRVGRAQGEMPKLAARLSAVPNVRQFMESIHQRGEIHYTIHAERNGIRTVLVQAKQ
jgi:hypothetical protein